MCVCVCVRACVGVFDSWRQALTESQMARVPHLIQMGITGARARETTRHNRKMRRSMSEPRASLHEKQELMGRIEHAWMKHAQQYWQLAEDECNVAREWYEHMALLYDKLCKEVRQTVLRQPLSLPYLAFRPPPDLDAFVCVCVRACMCVCVDVASVCEHDREGLAQTTFLTTAFSP